MLLVLAPVVVPCRVVGVRVRTDAPFHAVGETLVVPEPDAVGDAETALGAAAEARWVRTVAGARSF
jgi:hypothetical protein